MLIELLSHTPFYIYWIFFSLLFVGISQTKTRQTGLKRGLGIPLLLIFVSLYAIVSDFGISALSAIFWFCGIIFIVIINKIVKSHKEVKYSSLTKIFTISGSYKPLFMMMVLFFTKYTVGVATAIQSPDLNNPIFIGSVCLLYGTFSGMYFVRFFVLISKLSYR